jgi:hypothetical protein
MFGASGWLGASAMAKANKEIEEEDRIKELEEVINSLIHSIEDNADDYLVMQEACDKAKLLLLSYKPKED